MYNNYYRQHPTTLKEVMREIVRNLSPSGDEELQIHVRRRFILEDALREGNKGKFVKGKLLKVCRHTCIGIVSVVDVVAFNMFTLP